MSKGQQERIPRGEPELSSMAKGDWVKWRQDATTKKGWYSHAFSYFQTKTQTLRFIILIFPVALGGKSQHKVLS